eukprot:2097541-Prymnesium_polylepis.1
MGSTRLHTDTMRMSARGKPATPWLSVSCRSCAAASSHRFLGSAHVPRAPRGPIPHLSLIHI